MSDRPDNIDTQNAKKKMIIKVGVSIISFLLLAIWLMSVNYSVKENVKPDPSEDSEAWKQEMNKMIDEVEEKFSNINTEISSSTPTSTPTSTPAGTEGEEKSSLEDSATSTEVNNGNITTTSTPEKIVNDYAGCPEYINCMPTIGEARPCVIPPGCENFTQIAY